MVVATSPTARGRDRAARAFMEWGFRAFDSRILFPAGLKLASARVQNGGLRHVDLVTPRPFRLAMPRGARPKVTLKVRYDGPLNAPIAKGASVAQLLVFFNGRQVSALPLAAQTSISSATQLQRIFNGLAGWLPWS